MSAQADIRKWFLKKPDHGGSQKEKSQLADESPEKGSKAYKKESKFFAGGGAQGKQTLGNGDKVKLKLDRRTPEGGKRKSGEGAEDLVIKGKPSPKKPRLVIPATDDLGGQDEGSGQATRRSKSGKVVQTPPEKTPTKSPASQKNKEKEIPAKTPARGRGRGKIAGCDDVISEQDEEKPPVKTPPVSRGKSSGKAVVEISTPETDAKTPSRGRGRGAAGRGEEDSKPAAGRGGGRGRGWGGGGPPPWLGGSRGTPPHKGEKEVPKGAEDALAGLTFVISGTLDSLEREEAEYLIKSHGGRITASVSKKTDYLLADEDIGGVKSKKAKETGVKFLTEDELFAMIIASKPKSETSKTVQAKTPAKSPGMKISEEPTGLGVDISAESGVVANQAGKSAGERLMKQDAHIRSLPPTSAGKAVQELESWPNKHQPKSTSDIIANPGIVKQLKDWLQRWDASFLHPVGNGTKGKKKTAASGSNGEKKAVLLSGTPGIGKTTTARLVCKELGFETLEVNASDARGKADSKVRSGMGGRTANTIKEMVNNESISFGHQKTHSPKSVLIMDEVDGMSGGDRGGVTDLIASIKSSRLPIICICNDKYSQKLKSLQNYCLPLVYRKPTKQQMAKRLQQVAKAEGLQVDDVTLEDIAERTNGDMRMALNQLQYMSLHTRTLKFADVHSRLLASSKDEDISGFTAADKLLGFDGGRLRMDQRVDLHMSDMDLVPLIVQENYLNFVPSAANPDQSGVTLMNLAALAATSIAEGDIVNVQIRRRQQWQHSQTGAFLSSIIPAALMHGRRTEFEGGRNFNRFPGWLGKNSSYGKKVRLLEDVHIHLLASRICEPTREAIRMGYVPLLALNLSHPLRNLPKEAAVEEVVGIMEEYSLTQDDYETVMDISKFKGHPDPLEGVPPAVKTALTKCYKQREQDRVVRSADLLPAMTLPGQRKATKKPARLKLEVEDSITKDLDDDGEADDDQAEGDEADADEEDEDLDSLPVSNGTTKVTVDYANQKGANGQRGGVAKSKASGSKTPRKTTGDAKAGSSGGKRKR